MDALPQWTTKIDKRGLDPLGMQNAGVVLYQALLPGISNITLRMRYYGFFCWLSDSYARRGVATDFEIWRQWVRRAEALFALVCADATGQNGVGGIDWAVQALQNGDDVIDFAAAASTDASAKRYLIQSLGVFGAAYYTQMQEMGLFELGPNDIQRITPEVGLAAANAFRASIGQVLETKFIAAVDAGKVDRDNLAALHPIVPSRIPDPSDERVAYENTLFAAGPEAMVTDRSRRASLSLILDVAARETIIWARDRAHWLDGRGGQDGPHILEDGTSIAFLARPGNEGIGARFASFIGGEAVERLVIASPYWDADLGALSDLRHALAPEHIVILLDVNRHEFPTGATLPENCDIVDISGWQPSRFKHAKVVIAVTEEHDHVLSGSANCTVAALGREGFAGMNAEACMYRRLPRGTATAALGMDGWLEANPFPLPDLPDPVEAAPIPLDEMHAGGAGTFEAEGGRLIWRRPPGRWPNGTVILSNASGEVVAEIQVATFGVDGDRLTTWVGQSLEEAAFARVLSNAGESLRGYLVHRSALRARRRESAGGSVGKALAVFDEASEMQIRMLQAFDELGRSDAEDKVTDDAAPRGSARAKPIGLTAKPEVGFMTYEEFMGAGSARKRRGGRSDSTVAGTHFDSVRALLNRLSGVEYREPGRGVPRDDGSWMDLGDETGELSDAVEEPEVEEAAASRVRPAPDMSAYDRAVKTYVEGLAKEGRMIGPREVLRLRLWIVLVLWEARCEAAPNGMPAVADDKGWPRLIVRIVAGFFIGKNSPIGRLVMSSDYDDMPIDFCECWSTILWSLDAIAALVPDQPRTREFRRRIPTLRAHVVTALGLTPAELRGELMISQRLGLDIEFGTRLGVLPDARVT